TPGIAAAGGASDHRGRGRGSGGGLRAAIAMSAHHSKQETESPTADDADVARLDRLYSMVREINKHILRGHDEAELFASECRIAVEIGPFRFAWVGFVSADGAHIVPVARWGY